MTDTPSSRACKADGKRWAVVGSEYCRNHMPPNEHYARAAARQKLVNEALAHYNTCTLRPGGPTETTAPS